MPVYMHVPCQFAGLQCQQGEITSPACPRSAFEQSGTYSGLKQLRPQEDATDTSADASKERKEKNGTPSRIA